MTRFGTATYHDGRKARAHAVELAAEAGDLVIAWPDGTVLARWPAAGLQCVQPDRPDRALVLSPDGVRGQRVILDAANAAALRRALPDVGRARRRRTAWRVAVAASAGVALAGGLALGFDRAVTLTAGLLPASVERQLGQHTRRVVIDTFARTDGQSPICDNAAGAAALASLSRRLSAGAALERPVRVEVVRGDLVNAMALPGGHVLLFDGLLQQAAEPAEVAGVLAHELGHVRERHPGEALVRTLGLRAALTLLFGGSGLEDALGSAGAALLQLSYGRAAEREADRAALAILAEAGIDSTALADFLTRIAGGGALAWLSTHPPGQDRARRIAEAGQDGGPGLSPDGWRALRRICGAAGGREAGPAAPRTLA